MLQATALALAFTLGQSSMAAPQNGQLAELRTGTPLTFVENLGQWPAELQYRAQRGAQAAQVFADGFGVTRLNELDVEAGRLSGLNLCFRIESETRAAVVSGEEPRPGLRHYFLGADPDCWQTGVRGFSRLRFEEAWPGIDLVLREGLGFFEYDFELEAGADLSVAVLRVEGAQSLEIDGEGRLVIQAEGQRLLQSAPVAWTIDDQGQRRDHPCRFLQLSAKRFGFAAPDVPAGCELVVDPGVRWGTLLGSDDTDYAYAVHQTPDGETLVAGTTASYDYPLSPGAFDLSWNGDFDGFVSRLTRDGSELAFSTFIGGSQSDTVRTVAMATDGTVFLAGNSSSSNLPMPPGAYDSSFGGGIDAFVFHLDRKGDRLLHGSWLGGSSTDNVLDLILDAAGRPVVAGTSNSNNYPTTQGAFDRSFGGGGGDVVVSRLSADLATLLDSTYIGGTGNDRGYCLDLGADNAITVGGTSRSLNFPVTSGVVDPLLIGGLDSQDAFVTRLNSDLSNLQWSTYLGGDELEFAHDLFVAPDSSVVVTGSTASPNFPLGPSPDQGILGGSTDGFLSRLSADGTQLLNSGYFGGTGFDEGRGVCPLPSGGYAVAGSTESSDLEFPGWVFDASFGQNGQGQWDAVVLRYDSSGKQDYGTYLGGGGDDYAYAIDTTSDGDVVVCGRMNSFNFPITGGAFDTGYDFSSVPDGFLLRLGFDRYPFVYGTPKTNSIGGYSYLSYSGFPSLSGGNFMIWADGALPNTLGLFFHSSTPGEIPYAGASLLMRGPFQRTPVQTMGWLGSAGLEVSIDPSMVGTKRYYQFWYLDSGDPFGVGLSAAMEVQFYP